jgi:hypothetical protein
VSQPPRKIPRLPRLYCGRMRGHRGYLKELKRMDNGTSVFLCQACGWEGILPTGSS